MARTVAAAAALFRVFETAQLLLIGPPVAELRIPSLRIGGPDGPLRFVPQDLDEWIDAARAAWHPADSRLAKLRRAAGAKR